MRDNALLLLGMATQAIITSVLTQTGIIDPVPAQQFLTAVILLIVAILVIKL